MKQELLARLSALGILLRKKRIDLMLSTGSHRYLLEERAKSEDLLLLTSRWCKAL